MGICSSDAARIAALDLKPGEVPPWKCGYCSTCNPGDCRNCTKCKHNKDKKSRVATLREVSTMSTMHSRRSKDADNDRKTPPPSAFNGEKYSLENHEMRALAMSGNYHDQDAYKKKKKAKEGKYEKVDYSKMSRAERIKHQKAATQKEKEENWWKDKKWSDLAAGQGGYHNHDGGNFHVYKALQNRKKKKMMNAKQ